jgi:hypothetical protein
MSDTERRLTRQIFDAALSLVEWSEGDIETARRLWSEVFEEVERIDHNQSLGEPDEFDRAVDEQRQRFDQAAEARRKFEVVR